MINLIPQMCRLYNGFWINEPVGNNAFCYQERQNKRIWVPPLTMGNLNDVSLGKRVVFSEIDEGVERNVPGLEKLVYWDNAGTDIFIMDNHNHAFFFWMIAIQFGNHPKGLPLVHVDMHKDMREPRPYKDGYLNRVKDVWEYTNYHLNVGNFILPALKQGLFSDIIIIDSSMDFEQALPEKFVLDIDLDIFAPEMDYINEGYKIDKIRNWLSASSFITFAISPYFIESGRALERLVQIFKKQ